MATSAGHPGRPNEDFVGAVPGAAVLLDGAGIPGTESICRHGVAWYTHRLGGALLARLSRDDGRDLTAVLAEAIDEIAADHRGTCDITNPSSPQATVVIARLQGSLLDYLLLADCFLVLDHISGGPLVISDEREVTARHICTAPLAGAARNGASRIVSPYALTSWPGMLQLLRTGGPAEIIRRVRQAEATISHTPGAEVPDDATVAHCNRLHSPNTDH
jgi:hypothetical protein